MYEAFAVWCPEQTAYTSRCRVVQQNKKKTNLLAYATHSDEGFCVCVRAATIFRNIAVSILCEIVGMGIWVFFVDGAHK